MEKSRGAKNTKDISHGSFEKNIFLRIRTDLVIALKIPGLTTEIRGVGGYFGKNWKAPYASSEVFAPGRGLYYSSTVRTGTGFAITTSKSEKGLKIHGGEGTRTVVRRLVC